MMLFWVFLWVIGCNLGGCEEVEVDLAVDLAVGKVVGKMEGEKVCSFVGIPYGKAERWSKPTAVEHLPQSPFRATKEPAPCPQVEAGVFLDENCLKLSLYAPVSALQRKRNNSTYFEGVPVIFWIFGGAYLIGGAWENGIYNGMHLASKLDCILVSFNYRVGALGFMVTDTLKGNYAIYDQILALEWVKKHISAFGGNPSNITLMGESAGAFSALLLLQSWEKEFSKAFILSPPLALKLPTIKQAKRQGNALLARLGCKPNDAECGRSKSVRQILAKQPYIPNIAPPTTKVAAHFLVHMPIVDGDAVLAHPNVQHQWKIPVVIGTNQNELSLLSFFLNPNDGPGGIPSHLFSHLGYITMLEFIFKEHATKVLQQYPARANPKENWETLMDLFTDYIFRCPVRKMALEQSNAMLYHFEYIQGYLKSGECKRKCCHSTEIPLLFASLPSPKKAYLSVSNGYGHEECLDLLAGKKCTEAKLWNNPQQWLECSMCNLIENVSKRADWAFTEADKEMINWFSSMIGQLIYSEESKVAKPWESFSRCRKIMKIVDATSSSLHPEELNDKCNFWDSIAPNYDAF